MNLLNGARSCPLAARTVEQVGAQVALVASLPPRPAPKRVRVRLQSCQLCGGPSLGPYCPGHEWAYGEPQA